MATNNKAARNIIVGDIHYKWRATGNDGWISVCVWPTKEPGPKICGSFPYHEKFSPTGDCSEQLVITNRIIRRFILVALKNSYDPKQKGRQFNLGHCEKLIDLSDAVRATK